MHRSERKFNTFMDSDNEDMSLVEKAVTNDFLQKIASLTHCDWRKEAKMSVIHEQSNLFTELESLLEIGADINAKFGYPVKDTLREADDTPLTFAVKQRNLPLTIFLLNHGADTEVFEFDQTPLMKAAFDFSLSEEGHGDFINALLRSGANVNTKNKDQLTAMHYILLSLREWLFDLQKNPAMKVMTDLLDSGFEGNIDEICYRGKKRGYSDDVCNMFREMWKECYNQTKKKQQVPFDLVAVMKSEKSKRNYFFENPAERIIEILSQTSDNQDEEELFDAMNKPF